MRIAAFFPDSKTKMSHLDKKITEVQEQLTVLRRQREAARLERAKSYADAFIRKLEADDIPLAMGLQAFQDLKKFSGAASTSSPRNLPSRS
jgi:phosphoribosylamine-glycine ligase